MKSTGNSGDKVGYRILLLLVVGLTAFSSAMKELNQVQQLSLDASNLVAQLTAKLTPTEIPLPPVETPLLVKAESCESQQSEPSVELPWLDEVAQEEACDIEAPPAPRAPAVAKKSSNHKDVVAKLNNLRRLQIDPVQFEVRISRDHDADADEVISVPVVTVPDVTAPAGFEFKARTRKHNTFRLSPRDREMLKTLNRSINLRIAS